MSILNDVIESVPQVGSLTPLGYGPAVVEFFDFFFSDNLGIPAQDFDAFVQWDVSGGSVDLVGGVGPGVFGAPPEQPTGRYVDLGGSTGDPGLFETRFEYPVIAGQTYNFTFDYRSTEGDANSATAYVGDRAFTVSSSDTDFQRFSQSFTATETGTVRIAFQGNEADTDGSGIGIDGVLFGIAGHSSNGVPPLGTPGADTVVGTDLPNLIISGAGNDTVTAGLGNDTVFSNQGDDLVFGNEGSDLIFTGQDNDTVYGGRDADGISGNRGNDQIFGNEGGDQLFGNEGNDFVHGGQGNDSVYGGQGDDILNGGAGDDLLQGGFGADTYVFVSGQGNDVVTDFRMSEGDRLDLGGQSYTVADANGSSTLTLSGGGTIVLNGFASSEIGDAYFV